MDKKQESKIKMYRAVSGILAAYEEIVKKVPKLEEEHNKLDVLIEDTEKYSQGQLNTGKEHTEEKNNERELLEADIILVCAAITAYAISSTDETAKLFKTKYKIEDSVIKRMRDMKIFTFGYQVYSDTLPYANKLEPFASPEDITRLKNTLDTFNVLLPKRRAKLNKSVISTKNLAEAIDTIDLLLSDSIDVLVKPMQFKSTDLFNSYQNARIIIDAPSRKSKKGVKESKKPTEPEVK